MSKMNQKTAVYTAIMNTLAERNIGFDDGQDVSVHMSKEVRADVRAILVAGFISGEIELEATKAPEELPSYCSGLISNWVKKDKRLNGNVKHEAKNPGSRAGAGDAQLKALRGLLKTVSTDAERAEIQGYIDQRVSEVAAAKPTTVKVNIDDLPAELRAKYA